jgi:flagellar hook-basal body complex protein FliE
MSLINALSGLGGNFFNSTRSVGNTGDANALSAGTQAGKPQDIGSLIKDLSGEKLQNVSETEQSRLLADNSQGTAGTNSGRSIFAEIPSGNGQDAFVSTLNGFMNDVNAKGLAAEQANEDIMTGKSDNIHQAMISMQEASISFDLLVQVRNKLVDAYKELSRISV